jgi:hypothetical protein
MTDGAYGTDLPSVVEPVFESVGEEALIVGPSVGMIEAVVEVVSSTEAAPSSLEVLATEAVLKAVRDDFILAAETADLVEGGTVSLRASEESFTNMLVVTDEELYAVVGVDGAAAALPAEEAGFIEDAHDSYEDAYEMAESFALRTPGRTRIRETLEEAVSPAMQADFEAVLSSVETLRGDDDPDAVTLALLVAAKNEELLYDVSKWGEDIGLASKATFSRTKTEIEDEGLIDTEKVPIDVGRPRLRLLLADETLAGASTDEFVSAVRKIVS